MPHCNLLNLVEAQRIKIGAALLDMQCLATRYRESVERVQSAYQELAEITVSAAVRANGVEDVV